MIATASEPSPGLRVRLVSPFRERDGANQKGLNVCMRRTEGGSVRVRGKRDSCDGGGGRGERLL